MTALRMSLQAADSLSAVPAMKEQLSRAQQLAEEVDQSIDALTWDLRPAALDHIGLAAALSNLVSGWSQRFGIAAEFSSSWPGEPPLAAETEANLYRLTQEALHNVAKHAQASQVSVLLEFQQQHLSLSSKTTAEGLSPTPSAREVD